MSVLLGLAISLLDSDSSGRSGEQSAASTIQRPPLLLDTFHKRMEMLLNDCMRRANNLEDILRVPLRCAGETMSHLGGVQPSADVIYWLMSLLQHDNDVWAGRWRRRAGPKQVFVATVYGEKLRQRAGTEREHGGTAKWPGSRLLVWLVGTEDCRN